MLSKDEGDDIKVHKDRPYMLKNTGECMVSMHHPYHLISRFMRTTTHHLYIKKFIIYDTIKIFYQFLFVLDALYPTYDVFITVPDSIESANDSNTVTTTSHSSSDNGSIMPVIRKKERDYEGMFEFRKEDIGVIIRHLVIGKSTGYPYPNEKSYPIGLLADITVI